MKKITFLFTFLLAVNISAQTIFDWDTAAIDNGDNVTETIDGITVTVSGAPEITFASLGDGLGSSGNVLINGAPGGDGPTNYTSITFSFSEAVDVVSILAMDGLNSSIDYTFIPTGGSNPTVVVDLVSQAATANLNWTDVTSFTVTSSGSWFAFDNLAITPNTFPMTFDWDTAAIDNGDNVTETIDGITLTVSDALDLTFEDLGGLWGSSGNGVIIVGTVVQTPPSDTSITFTFSEPVNVVSILAMDGLNSSIDYTFTPIGGSNAIKVVSLSGNKATANLDWTGVTSFTVTSTGSWFVFDNLAIRRTTLPVTFDWDTAAIDNGDNVTETIDGITLTVSDAEDVTFADGGGFFGSTANILLNGGLTTGVVDGMSITFSFSEPVNVVSILAMNGNGSDIDYTFTPIGGSNPIKVQSLTGGFATVNLNWTGVTSFTVTSTGSWFAFDNLEIISGATTLSINDVSTTTVQKVKVYPNPVENILYIKNISNLKSISIFNSLGQLVLQSKQESIDLSHLSRGMYILQIHTSQGTETKRIIKK